MGVAGGAALVVKALEDEGIHFAFGIPGTHNIELYDVLAESAVVRPVLITDEQSAGFMADGAWRASGRMACVNLVPGAGLTHALSGIAEAFLDGVPMLVLGCGIRRDQPRAFQLHDVDQLAIAAPITKATFRPASGGEIYATIRQACRLARSGSPGPVMVEIPVDQYLFRHSTPDGARLPPPLEPPAPDPAGLEAAARLLRAPGARPLLYLGLGAAGAGPELIALAEALGAPVATTISGKGVFPESHPLFAWNGFGDAAPPFVRELARRATVTLALGCRFSEVGTASYSSAPRGDLIHVDIDPLALGRNYPARVSITADAAAFVRALRPRLTGGPASDRNDVARIIRDGRAALAAERAVPPETDRVSPARLFAALQGALGPDTVFATDSGNGTFLAMEHLVLDRPRSFLAPVDYSSMGYAVPAAIGAKLARPDRPVVALPGDGAFLMTGLELLTAASQGVAVAVFVLRDRELAQIAQFQRTAFNRPAESLLPDYDVGSLAEGVGVEWVRLDRDAEIEAVLAWVGEVLAAGRPIVVDTAIDYSRPTWFTRGVVKTNLGRLPFTDRLRFVARALRRRLA